MNECIKSVFNTCGYRNAEAVKKSSCPVECYSNLACGFSSCSVLCICFCFFYEGEGAVIDICFLPYLPLPLVYKAFRSVLHTYSSGKYLKVGYHALLAAMAALPCFVCTNACKNGTFKAYSPSLSLHCSLA